MARILPFGYTAKEFPYYANGTPMRIPFPAVGLTIAVIVLVIPFPARPHDVHPLFKNPPMVESHNGRLDVDLVAAPATYKIDGHRFEGMLYNGAYILAMWRVRAGDTVNVTLHNRLAEDTNFHFHGLDVSPLGNGDNVYLHIHPSQTFHYQVTIPQRHVGIFWFHPHLHGDVDRQIIGGSRAPSSSKAAIGSIRSSSTSGSAFFSSNITRSAERTIKNS
jgi:hypothetical protein